VFCGDSKAMQEFIAPIYIRILNNRLIFAENRCVHARLEPNIYNPRY
jgi:hypothetical protein